MAKKDRIRGITIEIGGDTTKLQSALKGVNTQIYNTKSALTDVEKLLKLDPGNTELLAQRHKLLGQAVEETKDKLAELKQASEQAAKTKDNYDAWKAKYDPIRTEITKTGDQLSKLKEKAAESDKQLAEGTLSKEKYDALQAELAQTEEKLKGLREQAKAVDEEFGHPVSPEQYDSLQREIAETTQNLKELEKQAAQSGEAVQAIAAKGERLKSAGDTLKNVGTELTTHVTAPIAAAGTVAVKTASDFDTAMSKVQAISGATGEEIDALREKAREMGAKTKFSASEAAAAMEYMAMAGWKTEDMLSGIDGIMNLAAASGEDLATTSDIVTDALTAFGMGTKDSAHFADVLAAASSNANTNVAMMGESFKYVAPAAGALNYSAEDVALALGLMANSGIKADQAGTSLRNLFLRMAKPTEESEAAMSRLGLSLYDTEGRMYSLREIMQQLRGSFQQINMPLEEYDAQIAALDEALEAGTIKQKEYDKELEELNLQAFGAEGAEKARAAAMLGGARAMSGLLAIANASEEDYNKLAGAIDSASDAFVKTRDGAVIPMSQAMQEGREWVEEYAGSAQAMSAVMLDNLGGDITILLSMLQELAISFGELIIPVLRVLVGWLQGIVDWLNNLDEGTKGVILTIAAIAAAIGPLLVIVGTLLSSVGQIMIWAPAIAGAISMAGAAITGTALPAIFSLLAAIGPFLLGGAVIAGVAAGLVWIVTQWVENWDSIKATFREIGADLKAQMDSIWQGIQSVFSAIREGFSDFVSSADGWGADLIRGLVGGILGKIAMVRDAVSTVAGTISAWLHFSVPDVGPLTEYEQWMPDFIGGLVRGIERTRPMLQQAVGALATDLMLTPEPGNVAAMTSGGGGEDGILSIVGILSQYLPYLPQLAKLQVVTDTGTLVGALAPGMDRALGERSVRERRL